jgi:TetR/AcrR family transcriptional repressor of nem operon
MRYDADHKQRSRERVIAEAANAIRRDGPHGLSVGGVMQAAGLTHGAFYAHFASREALLAAGVERMFDQGRGYLRLKTGEGTGPKDALRGYIGFYLSRSHRDTREAGCPLPFLTGEAARLSPAMRERYAKGVAGLTAAVAELLRQIDDLQPEITAASVMSELVGAVSLARAESDPERSREILKASAASLTRRLGLSEIH